jgi:hypothetical protein
MNTRAMAQLYGLEKLLSEINNEVLNFNRRIYVAGKVR